MAEENISQEFRWKDIDEARNYLKKLFEEINQNKSMIRKHKKVCTVLNYIEQWLILVSAITGCISISAFSSLFGIPISIPSSAAGLKICVITLGVQNHKSIIK